MTSVTETGQLAGPFCVIGLVGGALTGSIVPNDAETARFALVTALNAACFGTALTYWMRRRGPVTPMAVFVAATFAGSFNGAILMSAEYFPLGMMAGAVAGIVFAVPFVPALILVCRWERPTVAAHAGSVVDRARCRGPWAATAVAVAIATSILALHRCTPAGLFFFRLCAALAAGVLGLIVLLDVRAWKLSRAAADARSQGRELPGVELGVGEDATAERAPTGIPYREPARRLRICGGDPHLAENHLRGRLRRHAASFTVSLLVLGLHAYLARLPMTPTARLFPYR